MTVEVYKPVLKSRPVQSVHSQPVVTARIASKTVADTSRRKIRDVYRPIEPRMDLAMAIEDLTHPDEPSFAAWEALVIAEGLS